ncbi:hypothetical protein EVAR_89249_1 [Eumeta japonica]|uniref:Uncharacterized protein n=1 Tax=Eumeta variegata TaxID=151549 RepID=A0A4C1VL56_EUMVA|nr:hypothetical protein EVAR_89249_1 [Eumeta japonica]
MKGSAHDFLELLRRKRACDLPEHAVIIVAHGHPQEDSLARWPVESRSLNSRLDVILNYDILPNGSLDCTRPTQTKRMSNADHTDAPRAGPRCSNAQRGVRKVGGLAAQPPLSRKRRTQYLYAGVFTP